MFSDEKNDLYLKSIIFFHLMITFKGIRDNPEIETEISEVLLTVSSVNV